MRLRVIVPALIRHLRAMSSKSRRGRADRKNCDRFTQDSITERRRYDQARRKRTGLVQSRGTRFQVATYGTNGLTCPHNLGRVSLDLPSVVPSLDLSLPFQRLAGQNLHAFTIPTAQQQKMHTQIPDSHERECKKIKSIYAVLSSMSRSPVRGSLFLLDCHSQQFRILLVNFY